MADLSFLETDSSVIYDTLITAMEKEVGEPLYPGDERRIFSDSLAAVFVSIYSQANDACKQKMLQYASGEVLDAIGERYNCERIVPTMAKTTIRFSLKAALNGNILIAAGTRVTPDNEIYFMTTENAVLQAGKLSVDIPGIACGAGASYNGYSAGTLNQLVDLVPYIDYVTNTVATYNGDDGEPYPETDGGIGDNKYRERIKLAPTALSVAGPNDAYRYHVMSADSSIADVSVVSVIEKREKKLTLYGGCAFIGGKNYIVDTIIVDNASPESDYYVEYKDDLLCIHMVGDKINLSNINISINQEMAGEVLIVPILDGGMIPDETVLQKVKDACSAEDVRPMTDMVLVQAPIQKEYDIEIIYYTTEAAESDCINTIEGAQGAIIQYVAWQGEKLGRDINPDKLRSLCLVPTDGTGCKRITVIKPEFLAIKETEVAVYSGKLSVSHVVEEE